MNSETVNHSENNVIIDNSDTFCQTMGWLGLNDSRDSWSENSNISVNIDQSDGNISLPESYSSSSVIQDPGYNRVNGSAIPVVISQGRHPTSHSERLLPVRKTIGKCEKAASALNLPIVMNLNARSIYNKINEFQDVVTQYEVDLIMMSETWERENLKLSEILKLDNYQVVTNVVQRRNRGGKSAIIVNTDKYYIKELCPDPITVPIGVEVVWAMLLPKYNRNNKHNINNIAVASIYSKPRSRKKRVLLDHIAAVSYTHLTLPTKA